MKLSFFHDPASGPALSFGTDDLQILGGDISGFMDSRAGAHYTQRGWSYSGRYYQALAVTGGGCLLFGNHDNLAFISDPVDHFYFIGASLSANGVAIARYDSQDDLWQGVERRMWCRQLRILGSAAASAVIAGGRLARLNPWENNIGSGFHPPPKNSSGERQPIGLGHLESVNR
jgi:hypothetical protein